MGLGANFLGRRLPNHTGINLDLLALKVWRTSGAPFDVRVRLHNLTQHSNSRAAVALLGGGGGQKVYQ